jgi:hypothetical protein
VFASRDSGPKSAVDTQKARAVTVAAGSVDEVSSDSVRDPGESASVPFIVSLGDRARQPPAPPVRVRPIPDVRGLPLREAVHTLHESGFRVQLASGASGTAPEAGTPLRTGSIVRLYQPR